eukprot:TRINITY_DN16033_c0_g1_i1.p1 TRINITY_DN16033_c0_g1~~TRINITY_DN16033_c0_g1_i1.p1  ORF type:complete len:482 (-),score=104.64 TRINITY_DN16033_c0_g1_i1:353-1720(-)
MEVASSLSSLEELIESFPDPPDHPIGRTRDEDVSASAHVAPIRNLTEATEEEEEDVLMLEDFDMDMLLQGCRGLLNPGKEFFLIGQLSRLRKEDVKSVLAKAHETIYPEDVPTKTVIEKKRNLKSSTSGFSKLLAKRSKRSGSSVQGQCPISLSERVLTFGLGEAYCPLREEMADKIVISSNTGRHQFKITQMVDELEMGSVRDLSISPPQGSLKKPKDSTEIAISLFVKQTTKLQEVLRLTVEGVGHFYFVVIVESEPTQFGYSLSKYKMPDGSFVIPRVLRILKRDLESLDYHLETNIFSVPSDDMEKLKICDQLNRNAYRGSADPHVLANIIKHWFRELPRPLLHSLPPPKLLGVRNSDEAVELLSHLDPNARKATEWLVSLLAPIALHEKENSMSARGLATVFVPTIFATEALEECACDFLQYDTREIMDHCTMILQHWIEYEMALQDSSQ